MKNNTPVSCNIMFKLVLLLHYKEALPLLFQDENSGWYSICWDQCVPGAVPTAAPHFP